MCNSGLDDVSAMENNSLGGGIVYISVQGGIDLNKVARKTSLVCWHLSKHLKMCFLWNKKYQPQNSLLKKALEYRHYLNNIFQRQIMFWIKQDI